MWDLRRLRRDARPGRARDHWRQSGGSWRGNLFHRGLHSGGGASIFQHHPLKFQLAVAHLQDGFKQGTKVRGITRRHCGARLGRFRRHSSSSPGAVVWADAGVQRNGFQGARACRPCCSVGWIGKLLRVHWLRRSSPERRSWHARGTRRLGEAPGGFRRASVPAKVAICCRTWT